MVGGGGASLVIPRQVFQTWKSMNLPTKAIGFQASWRAMAKQSGFEYLYYTDEGCEEWVRSTCTTAETQAYFALTVPVERADLFRYLKGFYDGGVYGDIDTQCVTPPQDWPGWGTSEAIVGVEFRSLADNDVRQVCQWVFAAAPRSTFMRRVVDRVVDNISHPERFAGMSPMSETLAKTGPWAFTAAFWDTVQAKDCAMTLLDKDAFAAQPSLTLEQGFTRGVMVTHGFFGTWKPSVLSGDWLKQNKEAVTVWSAAIAAVLIAVLVTLVLMNSGGQALQDAGVGVGPPRIIIGPVTPKD